MAQSAIFDAPDFEPPAYGRPMSMEAWEQLDDAGELVDGILEEEELPDFLHETVLAVLARLFVRWTEAREALIYGSEAKYALTKRRGRKPDMSVFLTTDRKLPRHGAGPIPPDIMIEVLSPRPRDHRRDRVQKLREYAAFGVRWYWLVDPAARTIEILRLGDDGCYVHAADATEGSIEVPGLDGAVLDLDAFWRRVDDALEPETPPSQP